LNIHIQFEEFDYHLLEYECSNWRYKEDSFRNIIFCEGYRGIQNPYLQNMKLTPLKGECLFVKSHQIPDFIYQSKYSIVPWDQETLWVGSNYNLKDTSSTVTDSEMRNQLDFANQNLLPGWTLASQDFGFRSTSADRRPIIGPIKGYQGLYVFNGFGTKGTSLIPYCRDMLLDFLLNGSRIDSEVSASRFSA
jgi:glycine oxidase